MYIFENAHKKNMHGICSNERCQCMLHCDPHLTLLLSEQPELYGVLAVLSAVGLSTASMRQF